MKRRLRGVFNKENIFKSPVGTGRGPAFIDSSCRGYIEHSKETMDFAHQLVSEYMDWVNSPEYDPTTDV